MRITSGNRGFTLLEMLVATTLMAILAGSLYATLSAGFRGRRTAEAALEPPRRAAAALDLMGADLESAVPPTGILAADFIGTEERGDLGEPADAVLFHAMTQDQSGATPPFPIRRVEFALATDARTGETMLLRRSIFNLLAPEQPEPIEEILCRGVRALELAYYDGQDWVASWDSAAAGDVLPRAVRLTLRLHVEDRDEGYELSRVFALPCGSRPRQAEGGQARMGGGDR